jgi:hypothetical protein
MPRKTDDERWVEEMIKYELELRETPPGIPEVFSEYHLEYISLDSVELFQEKDALLFAGMHSRKFLDVFMTPEELKEHKRDYRPFIKERIVKLAEMEKSITSNPLTSESEALLDEIRFTTAFWEVVIMVIHLYQNQRYITESEFNNALQNQRLHLLSVERPFGNKIITACGHLVLKVRKWALDHYQTKNEGRFNLTSYWESNREKEEE